MAWDWGNAFKGLWGGVPGFLANGFLGGTSENGKTGWENAGDYLLGSDETTYTTVGDPTDVQWLERTPGQWDSMYTQLGQQAQGAQTSMGDWENYLKGLGLQTEAYDPNAYYQQFLGQAGGLADLVSGQMNPLSQSLNGIAARQAALGGEAALSAMPGARHSGAGMAAFGQAYADPFAQAQAQLQSAQLQGTLGLWGNAMGLNSSGQQFKTGQANQAAQAQYAAQMQAAQNMAAMYGGLYGQFSGQQAQMAGDQMTQWQPTYIADAPDTGLLGKLAPFAPLVSAFL
jgi:hypothetical protein